MRHIIVITTLAILFFAFFVGVAWFYSEPDYEPALTSLVLLATIIGIFIDKWLSEKEKRQQLLKSLAHEIYMNAGVIDDLKELRKQENSEKPNILPRFYIGTLTNVISSGVFCTNKDKRLFSLLNGWLQRSTDANVRIAFSESYVFSNPESCSVHYKMLINGNVMKMTVASLAELGEHLLTSYSKESGIDADTVLFDID